MKKTKKPRKIDYFKGNANVKKHLEILKQLERSKDKIKRDIENIFKQYNARAKSGINAEHLLEKLPLDTLKELQEFVLGIGKESSMEFLNVKMALRKAHLDKLTDLQKIDEKISEAKNDLLLAKVKCLSEKVAK